MPDFFIVGHPKCGTTALHEMLSGHPQIHMCKVKEPHFFATDLRPVDGSGERRDRPYTLERYLELFAGAGSDQLVGEASTRYIWSHTAPGEIAAAQPAARIVAIFREPASFLRSIHLQLMLPGGAEDEPSLRRALELEPERREGRSLSKIARRQPMMVMYSERMRYLEQLRRYHAHFPAEQVLVLIYEDFRADNEGTVRHVLRFLGVDDSLAAANVRANPTVQRNQALDRRVIDIARGRGAPAAAAKRLVKLLAPRSTRRRALRFVRSTVVAHESPPADEELMLELRRRYRPEVEAFGEYLARDLVSLWGYDRLG